MKVIDNQTILITGSTDGLGKKVALELAKQGATILLHGRNPEKGDEILKEIISLSKNSYVKYFNADLSSLQSVRNLGAEVLREYQNIDILINNAGIYLTNDVRQLSLDGYELNWAVNYLAPFLLTHLLLPALQKDDVTKIINVSSGAQYEIDFDDVMLDYKYSSRRAYAQSKHAQIMFSFTLAAQLKDSKIRVNALHPEKLMNTKMVIDAFGSAETTVDKGAENVIYLATSPEVENITGAYLDKKQMAKARYEQAYSVIARDKLYRLSKGWTGI